jgi:hypothetical protein
VVRREKFSDYVVSQHWLDTHQYGGFCNQAGTLSSFVVAALRENLVAAPTAANGSRCCCRSSCEVAASTRPDSAMACSHFMTFIAASLKTTASLA